MITISIWFAVILCIFSITGLLSSIALLFAMLYVKNNGSITLEYTDEDSN